MAKGSAVVVDESSAKKLKRKKQKSERRERKTVEELEQEAFARERGKVRARKENARDDGKRKLDELMDTVTEDGGDVGVDPKMALLVNPCTETVAKAILTDLREVPAIKRLENATTGIKFSASKRPNGAFGKLSPGEEEEALQRSLDRLKAQLTPADQAQKAAFRDSLVKWGLASDAGTLRSAIRNLKKFKTATLSPVIKRRVLDELNLSSSLVNVGSGGFALRDGSFVKVARSAANAFGVSLADRMPAEVYIDDLRSLDVDSKWVSYGLGLANLSDEDQFLADFTLRVIRSMFRGDHDVIRMVLRFFSLGCLCQAADLLKLMIVLVSASGGGKSTLQELLTSPFGGARGSDSASGEADMQTSPMVVDADFVQRQGSSGSSAQKAIRDGRARACGLGIALPREIQTTLDQEKVKMHTAGERKTATVEVARGKKVQVELPHVGVIATCNPAQLGSKPTDPDALAKIACVGPDHVRVPSGERIFGGYGESVPQWLPPMVYPKPAAKPGAHIALERKDDELVAVGWVAEGALVFTAPGHETDSSSLSEYIDSTMSIDVMWSGLGYPRAKFAKVTQGGVFEEPGGEERSDDSDVGDGSGVGCRFLTVEAPKGQNKLSFVRSAEGIHSVVGIKPVRTDVGTFRYALAKDASALRTKQVVFDRCDSETRLVYFKDCDLAEFDWMVDDVGTVYYAKDIKDNAVRTACRNGSLAGPVLSMLVMEMASDPSPVRDFSAQFVPPSVRKQTDAWAFGGVGMAIPEILVDAMRSMMVVLDSDVALQAKKGSSVGMAIHALLTYRKDGKEHDSAVVKAAVDYFGAAAVDLCGAWKYRAEDRGDKKASFCASSPAGAASYITRLNALTRSAFGGELKEHFSEFDQRKPGAKTSPRSFTYPKKMMKPINGVACFGLAPKWAFDMHYPPDSSSDEEDEDDGEVEDDEEDGASAAATDDTAAAGASPAEGASGSASGCDPRIENVRSTMALLERGSPAYDQLAVMLDKLEKGAED